jgi:hypothetical protein
MATVRTDPGRRSDESPSRASYGVRVTTATWVTELCDVLGEGSGSFVSDPGSEHLLHEAGNPAHRCRVEHDAATLLVHLSGEDGDGWTTLTVDGPPAAGPSRRHRPSWLPPPAPWSG